MADIMRRQRNKIPYFKNTKIKKLFLVGYKGCVSKFHIAINVVYIVNTGLVVALYLLELYTGVRFEIIKYVGGSFICLTGIKAFCWDIDTGWFWRRRSTK